MCGIVGYFGRFDSALLTAMSACVAHRGPDDAGAETLEDSGGIGLAHRRLAILDLSPAGHQPMWDIHRRAAIVFNGEIYNFEMLREDLAAKGYAFRSRSDTEVLLNLYLDRGTAMLTALNGMFACAIWDAERRELFLARDPVGIKPLYYAATPQGFLFASELKALLCAKEVDRALDVEAIRAYLTYLWAPGPRTMLQGVRKLEPGCAMIVREGRIVRQWRYAELPCGEVRTDLTEREAVETLRRLLKQAVRRQMVADVPVGAFLSGGLDSSTVVHFAREMTNGARLQCFTIGVAGGSRQVEGLVDDLPYAKQAARHLGVDLHVVGVGPEMADRVEEMVFHLDEPQADPACLNVLFISELARRHGITVLLSGAGGDDIFTGYRRHVALMHEKFWEWLPRPARHALACAARHAGKSSLVLRRAAKAFAFADEEPDERLIAYFFWLVPEQVNALFAPDLQGRLKSGSVAYMLHETLARLPKETSPLEKMLFLEAKHFLADHNLNYTDKMSMAAGVEVRVPLLDPDVIAFAASLPPELKQRGTTGKWILRQAMEPFLPREVLYRPKSGFGAPLRRWLRHELRALVDDILSDAALKRRGIFDPAAVRALIEADRTGRIDGAYGIFALVCVELWCRQFIDRYVAA